MRILYVLVCVGRALAQMAAPAEFEPPYEGAPAAPAEFEPPYEGAPLSGSYDGAWRLGRATHFGTDEWSVHEGSCGYDEIVSTGYDRSRVAALADTFDGWAVNSGLCGACYELRCADAVIPDKDTGGLSRCGVCISDATVSVKVIDTCKCDEPENPLSNARWCCGDAPHFDLSYWAFEKLSTPALGVIGVEYRRVPCEANADDSIKLRVRHVDASAGALSAVLLDAAGAGKVSNVEVSESSEDPNSWRSLSLGWENSAVFEASGLSLSGAPLSVRVTAEDGEQVVSSLGVGIGAIAEGSTLSLGQQFSSGTYRMVRAQAGQAPVGDGFGTCDGAEQAPQAASAKSPSASQAEAIESIRSAPCGQPMEPARTSWWCSAFRFIPGVCGDSSDGGQAAVIPCPPSSTPAVAAQASPVGALDGGGEEAPAQLDLTGALESLKQVVDNAP